MPSVIHRDHGKQVLRVEWWPNRQFSSSSSSSKQGNILKTMEPAEGGAYTRREFSYQSFQRSFSLPENQVEDDKIAARYVDGILQITVPKELK